MKKLILIFAIALISLNSFSQITYKNVTIKEPCHWQDITYSQVYLQVIDWQVTSGNQLTASIKFNIYKSKEVSELHPDWTLKTNEIGYIDIPFEFGDIINAETIAGGIKQVLLYMYPNWSEANIIIE